MQRRKRLIGANGAPLVLKAVHLFQYLFTNYEYRTDYRYRTTTVGGPLLVNGVAVTPGAASGVSAPTYNLNYNWRSSAYALRIIKAAARDGFNAIVLNVEPAIQFSPRYYDYTAAAYFPAEADVLRELVDQATREGMHVIIRQTCDQIETPGGLTFAQINSFLAWLHEQFEYYPNVMICPRNEPNAHIIESDGSFTSNPDLADADVWETHMESHVTALRDAGYRGIIVLQTTSYSATVSEVVAKLNANAVFYDDPNILIELHVYRHTGESSFITSDLETSVGWWLDGLRGKYCIYFGEVGVNNGLGAIDPDLDPLGVGDPTEMANSQAYYAEFFRWVNEQVRRNRVHGIGFFNMGYYAWWSTLTHDPNSLYYFDGSTVDYATPLARTTFGELVYQTFLNTHPQVLGPARCQLQLISGVLHLKPKNGNGVPIDGRMETIEYNSTYDTETVTLAATGLTVSTLYYIYANLNSDGDVTLSAATTTPTIDEFTGLYRKSTDRAYTLVGVVYVIDSGGGTPAFYQDDARQFVRSVFCSPPLRLKSRYISGTTAVTSGSYAQIQSALVLSYVAMPGDVMRIDFISGASHSGTSQSDFTIATSINAAAYTTNDIPSTFVPSTTSSQVVPVACATGRASTAFETVSIDLYARTFGGTLTVRITEGHGIIAQGINP